MAYIWQPEFIGPLITQAEASLQDFDELTQDRLKGRILVLQSYIEGSMGDRKDSIQLAQNALRCLPNNDLSMRSFAILIIGNVHRFDGNLSDAITFHLDALELSEAAGDTILSVMILSRLIDMYRTMGQLSRAHKIDSKL
jgi:ATP/maltotriose-dependent transcriptional regulator MalT